MVVDVELLKTLCESEPAVEGQGRETPGSTVDFPDEIVGEIGRSPTEAADCSADKIAVLDFEHVCIEYGVEN